MVGVLLDAAAPGSTRPRLPEAADLLRGAARIRVARADARGWGDGLAVVSLVTTALACLWAPVMLAITIYGRPLPLTEVVPFLIWPVALLVGLVGRRRTAASLACAGVLATASAPAVLGYSLGGVFTTLGFVAAASAACSPGMRRGRQVLGPPRTALLLTGTALLSGLFLVQAYRYGPGHDGPLPGATILGTSTVWAMLGSGLLAVAAAIWRVGTPAVRRSTLVLAAPFALVTVMLVQEMAAFDRRLNALYSHGTLANASAVGAALLAAVLAAAFTSRRQRQPSGA